MSWLIVAGGAPMWFIVLFGVAALGNAAAHAYRPNARRVDIVRALSRATLFSIGAGVAADVAAVCIHVPENDAWAKSPDLHLILLSGLGECMAPAIAGFTLLSLAAFLTAIGASRTVAHAPSC